MSKKITHSGLSQVIGALINENVLIENVSKDTTENGWTIVFIIDESTTMTYTYDNQEDRENDLKVVMKVLKAVNNG